MAEKEQIYSSTVKYTGIFSFKDYYKFCWEWLVEEIGFIMQEDKYKEKIIGNEKELEIEWTGYKELTDYFKFDIKIKFRILGLSNVELNQNGVKIKTNKGEVKISVKGTLVRDYKGKFEIKPMYKFMRAVYEKYIITQRVEQFEDYVASKCDEFLGQAKAYLDLEGKR